MKLTPITAALLSLNLLATHLAYADTPIPSTFTSAQETAIQTIVHDYLLQHPEVMVNVFEKLHDRQMTQAEQQAKKSLRTNSRVLFADQYSPVVGNPNGTLNLVEFFDFNCSHCRDMAPSIAKLIKANANLRVVFKQLPIFGANSEYAAKAVLAVAKLAPNQYFTLHNALMASDSPLNKDKVLQIAQANGINTQQLIAAINSDKAIDAELKNNFNLANSLSIQGTPYFVIAKLNAAPTNNTVLPTVKAATIIPGALSADDLATAIDKVNHGTLNQ